ncbi:c-type cytochrome [Ningiella sp. W23]|uniref:c-type cytochrome n=1 Tax=Ningiella sp. W23 TaxID=3023715 RepID=UPI00375697AF
MKHLHGYISATRALIFSAIMLASISQSAVAQSPLSSKAANEGHYYRMTTLPVPEGIHLEVGGIATMPDGSAAVSVRRGEVWLIENPTMEGGTQPVFTLYANGLHEPLGMLYHEGALFVAQRGELTKLQDSDGDGKADIYETVHSWPLSSHYHEYSFGPKLAPDGGMFVTFNVAFGNEEWWRGESRVPWRGWTLKIHPDGSFEPWATGMRSPAGLGMYKGELFYTDNQGDWIGSGGLWHVKKGSFTGHPAGLKWSQEEGSPISLSSEQFYARVDKRQIKENGFFVKPENIRDEENPDYLQDVKQDIPALTLPSVILPHGILGVSNSEILSDSTGGSFGPFAGQLFVGDQGQSKIMRVALEQVNDEYQGVAFDFRSGFQSGVMRLNWSNDGRMLVGQTNRGWGSAGVTNSGLEILTWTGRMPLEMKTVRAMPDGFEIEFTLAIDKASAEDLDSYVGKSYNYKYHPVYGSPQMNIEALDIQGVKVSDDGKKVRVVVNNLRQYYVHEIKLNGIITADGSKPLLHDAAYYTLNNIPEGEKVALSELSTKRSGKASASLSSAALVASNHESGAPNYPDVEPLLVKNTCVACHKAEQRVIGPSFKAIAKRGYSDERIVELIYSPEPQNWPEFATPMPPMPQVPEDEALAIAAWINSLNTP